MASNVSEPQSNSLPAGAVPGGDKPQPSALEVPVLVNGARTVEGSDRREPFSENTHTVMVFANGCVIRLASTVSIGQLLFLTSEKTKKEVVCQVVKSKTQPSTAGYVELEFTEASLDFWGIRFASSAPAIPAPIAARPVEASATPLLKSLEKMAEKNADVRVNAAPPAAVPQTIAVKPAIVAEPAAAKSETLANKIQPAPVVPAPAAVEAARIPTLSEFLAHSENGAELRAAVRSKDETKAGPSETPASAAKQPKSELKNGLTAALLGSTNKSNGTAKLPGASANPAPGTVTFDFGVEEVKIPSWLEPLARNSDATPASADSRANEIKPEERLHPESNAKQAASTEMPAWLNAEPKSAEADASAKDENAEAVVPFSNEGPVPNFGSGLAFEARVKAKSEGSNKGLLLAIAVILLLLVAAGAWYWFSTQTTKAASRANESAKPDSGPGSSEPLDRSANSPAGNSASSASAPATTAANGLTNTVSVREASAAKSFDNGTTLVSSKSAAAAPEPQPEAKPVKKPVVGDLHLAPPVNHRKTTQGAGTEPEPAIGVSAVSGGDPNNLSLLGKSKEPAAPPAVPVGGDVKPARLLSSVAPVYSQLARNQHLNGNVVIDALIDANGNVATMAVISGPTILRQSAMDALHQWKYKPATLNGQSVPMHLSVTLQFKLQ